MPSGDGFGPPGSRFLGRDVELGRLEALARRAREGGGGCALVSGDPGIGKSALLTAFVDRLDPGTRIAWGRCRETAGAPTYWPWAQVLLACPRLTGSLDEPVERGLARLAEVAPDLTAGVVIAPGHHTSERVAQFEMSLATTAILESACADTSLVVVLDDLHAADPASVALLAAVAAELRHRPAVFVGAYREHELSDAARAELARLPGATEHITLLGLEQHAIEHIVTTVAGARPADDDLTSIVDLTQGNPLFVRELAALLAAGRDRNAHPRLPAAIHEVIRERLAAVGSDVRDLLDVAAVVGREFDVGFLAHVSGIPGEQALGLLEAAERSGVVEPIPGATPRFRFHHVVAQSVVYDALPTNRRLELHRAVADVIERQYADDLDFHAAELAHHRFAAAVAGDAERAIDALVRAGRRAERLVAFREALEHYERAVGLVELEGGAGSTRHGELLLALGRSGQKAGVDGAREALRRAADVARVHGLVDVFAEAALSMPVSLGTTGGRPAVDRESVAHLEEALALLPPGDSTVRALVLAELTDQRYWADPFERARELSAEAVGIARRLDDPSTLGRALAAHHYAIWGPDSTDERAVIADEVLALADQTRDPELEFMGHSARIPQLVERADGLGLDREIALTERLFDRLGHGVARWAILRWRAMRALMRGDLDEGETLAGEAAAVEVPDPLASLEYFGIQSFILAYERGTLGDLEPLFRPAVETYPDIVGYRAALVFILIAAGKIDEARAEFEYIVGHGLDGIRRDLGWATTIGLLCRAAAVVGDEGVNGQLHALIAPYADRCVVIADGTLFGGSNAHWAALTAWHGALPGADTFFQQAEGAYRRIGAGPFLAHALRDRGEYLLLTGVPDEARRCLDEAVAIYRRHGMGFHEALASELAGSTSSPVTPSPSHMATLRRDGDVWDVGFDGIRARLADVKGLAYLARLVSSAGSELHVLDLAGSAAADHSAGDLVLDEQARREYSARLRDLQEEADEARSFHDDERAAKAEAEMQAIAAELRGAVGLGGRARRGPSATERARSSVTKAIRSAIERIGDHVPALGAHLERSVRTGTYCSYAPDPTSRVEWDA